MKDMLDGEVPKARCQLIIGRIFWCVHICWLLKDFLPCTISVHVRRVGFISISFWKPN
jgi:hypothetical protein